MIGAALKYPLEFFLRRPAVVSGCLVAGWLLWIGLDILFVHAGYEDRSQSPIAEALYYFAGVTVQAVPASVLFVAALIDRGLREDPPRLKDAFTLACVSALFLLVVVGPVVALLTMATRSDTSMAAIVSLVVVCGFAFLYLRLAFAWPHAMATGRFVFLQSWSLSRGHLGVIAAAILPVFVAIMGVEFVTQRLYTALAETYPWADDPLVEASWIEAFGMMSSYVLDMVVIYLYSRLSPMRPASIARTF